MFGNNNGKPKQKIPEAKAEVYLKFHSVSVEFSMNVK